MKRLVQQGPLRLLPNPARVIARTFNPGLDPLIEGRSHAQAVMSLVESMTDEQVAQELTLVLASFASRHDDLRKSFRHNYEIVTRDKLSLGTALAQDRIDLLGAYFTEEFAIEASALFNPSIVRAPDQTACDMDCVRFIMSLRAVGMGHYSSISFLSGTFGADGSVCLDEASPHLSSGTRVPQLLPRELVQEALTNAFDVRVSAQLVAELPEVFDVAAFELHLRTAAVDMLPKPQLKSARNVVRKMAETTYQVTYDPTVMLSERVLVPGSDAERHGLEDARFVEFTEDDGRVNFRATCTAYDGVHVAPHFIETDDFLSFRVQPMFGTAAHNKDMALFPRRINGVLWSLSRWDRVNIYVAHHEPGLGWTQPEVVQRPRLAWDLVQLGACTSPIETSAGWLVLTHGVGPMRTYAIGAILLDLEDPTRVIGVLEQPLLAPDEAERDGYVPNVVYSCGALAYGEKLLLPYGCSDTSIRFAVINLPGLIKVLLGQSIDLVMESI